MLRVGKVTSAEEIAKMSGNLKYRPVRGTWAFEFLRNTEKFTQKFLI